MNPKKYGRDASTNSKAQLMALVEELGIGHTVRRKYAKHAKDDDGNPKDLTPKRELVRALQAHFLKSLYGNSVPQSVRDALVYRPMLAKATTKHSDLRAEAWNSRDWRFEKKVSGYRVLLGCNRRGRCYSFSRFLSDTDFLPIRHPVVQRAQTDRFVVDAELVATDDERLEDALAKFGYPVSEAFDPMDVLMSAPDDVYKSVVGADPGLVSYSVLDVLEVDERSVANLSYCDRLRSFRPAALDAILKAGLNVEFPESAESSALEDKKRFYYRMLEEGAEGVVAKDLRAPYERHRSDRWLKFKALKTDDDTLDAVVVRYESGDDAVLGVYRPWTDELVEVATCRVPGGESVAEVGSVVEAERVEGDEWRHVRLRPYKKARDCTAVPSSFEEER